MQIKQISVSGLFGIFNHIISLKTEARITIIHGLNGFGKTNILRILDGIFNTRYSVLNNIPFDIFKVEFDEGSIIEVIKENIDDKQKNIVLNFDKSGLKQSFLIPVIQDKDKSMDLEIPVLYSQGKKIFSKQFTSKINNLYNDENILSSELSKEPEWLNRLKNNIHIRLIESQRLLNLNYSNYYGINNSIISTVSVYSKELAELMQSKFTEYGKVSQSLDRTFPARAVKQQLSTDLTDKQLRQQLNELEETRSRLIKLGLLDKDENPNFPIQTEDINEGARSILSVYVEDNKKKLSIFDEIANKLELLKKIINRKFAYSYKEMNFSKEKGFVFTTCYPNSSESSSKNLYPTDLSSGEQHELVLLYELLFKVELNSLVLIDEPELSLHVGWQSQFLEDLKEITELADLDILMATHSPDIIQDRWDDLTVELKAPGK